MAIKHVVTAGFGFADGTAFIPTHGFTPGEAPAVPDEPGHVAVAQATLYDLTATQTELTDLAVTASTLYDITTQMATVTDLATTQAVLYDLTTIQESDPKG